MPTPRVGYHKKVGVVSGGLDPDTVPDWGKFAQLDANDADQFVTGSQVDRWDAAPGSEILTLGATAGQFVTDAGSPQLTTLSNGNPTVEFTADGMTSGASAGTSGFVVDYAAFFCTVEYGGNTRRRVFSFKDVGYLDNQSNGGVFRAGIFGAGQQQHTLLSAANTRYHIGYINNNDEWLMRIRIAGSTTNNDASSTQTPPPTGAVYVPGDTSALGASVIGTVRATSAKLSEVFMLGGTRKLLSSEIDSLLDYLQDKWE